MKDLSGNCSKKVKAAETRVMLFTFMEDFLKMHTGIALQIEGSCETYCLQCVLCSFQGTENLYKFA